MEEIITTVGPNIARFLNDSELSEVSKVSKVFSELSESVLLWRSLLSSFNPRSNKDSLKAVRVRTQKPRPASKAAPVHVHQQSGNSKQWIFIPPDLERQLKVITINKAGQLRKNEEFKSRCFQLLETWSDSISRTISILDSQETRGDLCSPYSCIIYWKDKMKVLEDIINELNDVCVAKVDAVFSGTKPHQHFIHQIEKVKRNHKESKVKFNQNIWSNLSNIELHLKDLESLDSFEQSIQQIIKTLQSLMDLPDWLPRIQKILSALVTKYMQTVNTEASFNKLFKNNEVRLLEKIQKIGQFLATSRLMNSEERVRPSTSYVKPAGKSEDSLIKVLHIVNVANELARMVDQLCHNDVPSRIVRIYTEVPVEFEIWKHENSVFWAQLVHAFYERLAQREKIEVKGFSDEEDEGPGGTFVVANWTIN